MSAETQAHQPMQVAVATAPPAATVAAVAVTPMAVEAPFKYIFPINPADGLKSNKRKREEEDETMSGKRRLGNQHPKKLQARNSVLKELRTPHKVLSGSKHEVEEKKVYPAEAIIHRIENLRHWDEIQRNHEDDWETIIREELKIQGMPVTLAPQAKFIDSFEEGYMGWLKANNKQTLRRYQQLYLLYQLATIKDIVNHYHEIGIHSGHSSRALKDVLAYSPELISDAKKLWEDVRTGSLRDCWSKISAFGQKIGSNVFCDQARIRSYAGQRHTPLCRKSLRYAIVARAKFKAAGALSDESLQELIDIHTCANSLKLPLKQNLETVREYLLNKSESLQAGAPDLNTQYELLKEVRDFEMECLEVIEGDTESKKGQTVALQVREEASRIRGVNAV